MRIAIDARELTGHPTGVGRVLTEILAAWARSRDASAHEFVLCAPEPVDLAPFAGLHVSMQTSPGAGTPWEQFTLPGMLREVAADVLLAPGYTAPLRSPVPVVLIVHDVSFAAHPEWFSWREGARRRTLTRLAALRARAVVTVSEFSRREIAAYLGIEAGKIHVIYHGLPPVGARGATDATGASGASASRQHVLYVGSIFNRRHVPELIEAFGRLAARHPAVHLDIVGDNRTSPWIDLEETARASGVAERIHLRSYVGDDELGRLYACAGAFVFLSDYEGFGLTPLEALGAGVPIVVLDTPVGHEVYGEAALFVSRPEPSLVAAALERALFDEQERARQLTHAKAVLSRYSWPDAAQRLLSLLTSHG